jgi:hypothetical protein
MNFRHSQEAPKMKSHTQRYSRLMPWFVALLATAVLAACGSGGKDPIFGAGGIAANAPTVTAFTPADASTGALINNPGISATFSETMMPLTDPTSFTVTCAAPCVNPTGSAALDSTGKTANWTLAVGSSLAPTTSYTVTVSGAKSLATGVAMATPKVWNFSTGSLSDVTLPRASSTVPATTTPGPTTGVPANAAVSITFTEEMRPATIDAASFTLTCALPCVTPTGTVSYAVGTRTATFTPSAALAIGETYTATVTTAATDLAGNPLAGNQGVAGAPSNYLWTFTTAAPGAPAPVTVASTNPSANANAVCPSNAINATFTVANGLRMDPASINASTFTLTGPAPALTPVVASAITLDTNTGTIATFTPAANLTAGVTYTATLKSGATGVKDMAIPANAMVSDVVWSFTAGTTAANCQMQALPPNFLGSAVTFGNFGGSAGSTNTGVQTIINGDIGTTAVSTKVTGFHDSGTGCTYTETGSSTGFVNGKIYTSAPPPTPACPSEGNASTATIANKVRGDTLTAYNALVAMAPGGNPDPGAGSLAGLVLAPGVYKSASGGFKLQGSDLTLDGQGNPNAVFVFQMASTLTIGGPGAAAPRNVILVNGAQAKNVFWQVGSAATINAGGGGTMVGTIISQDGTAVSTAGSTIITTINGRVLSLGASVTLVDTVVNVPAP